MWICTLDTKYLPFIGTRRRWRIQGHQNLPRRPKVCVSRSAGVDYVFISISDSNNGTWVDRLPLEKHQRRCLASGETISLKYAKKNGPALSKFPFQYYVRTIPTHFFVRFPLPRLPEFYGKSKSCSTHSPAGYCPATIFTDNENRLSTKSTRWAISWVVETLPPFILRCAKQIKSR